MRMQLELKKASDTTRKQNHRNANVRNLFTRSDNRITHLLRHHPLQVGEARKAVRPELVDDARKKVLQLCG